VRKTAAPCEASSCRGRSFPRTNPGLPRAVLRGPRLHRRAPGQSDLGRAHHRGREPRPEGLRRPPTALGDRAHLRLARALPQARPRPRGHALVGPRLPGARRRHDPRQVDRPPVMKRGLTTILLSGVSAVLRGEITEKEFEGHRQQKRRKRQDPIRPFRVARSLFLRRRMFASRWS
jgi:hypothetical protein